MLRKWMKWKNRTRISQPVSRRSPARRTLPAYGTILGLEWLESRRLLAAGDLDTAFDLDGRVVQDLGLGKHERIFASAIQSDGKIVVVGSAVPTAAVGKDFFVARFNSNGSLDSSFGTGGHVVVDVSDPGTGSFANQEDHASDLVIQSDGSILVAGTAVKGAGASGVSGVGIIKLTSSGQLDTSFDGDGKLITVFQTSGINRNTVSPDSSQTGVALTPDGKIVVGTSTIASSGAASFTRWDFTVARYNANGSLDTTFDGDGYAITDIDSSSSSFADDFVNDVKVQSDGRIVLVGRANNDNVKPTGSQDWAIVRYNTDGSLDNTFGGGDGVVLTDISPASFVSQDTANNVQFESDGQIIVSGWARVRAGQFSSDDTDFVIARYNADGALDSSFATTSEVPGTLRINVAGLEDDSDGLIIQPDGKYVVGGDIGGSGAANDFALVRVTTAGALDTSFSGDGIARTHFPTTSFTVVNDIAMQPDGKIVAVGWVDPTSGSVDMAMARFESGLIINTISGLGEGDEGATYTLNLSSNDPTTTEWIIDWGDGGIPQIVPGNPSSVTHVYADGTISRTISASLNGGTIAVGTKTITVKNVDPSLTVNQSSVVVNEGQTATNSGTFGDVAADTVSIAASIGTVTMPSPGVWNWSYDSTDDLEQVVTITATDEDGGLTTQTFNLTVNNVNPTITVANASVAVTHGATATNSGTFNDVPADTVTIAASIGTITQVGNTWSWSYNSGTGLPPQIVTVSATDDDFGWAIVTFSLNVEPNLTVVANQSANEASPVTITDIGKFTDVVQGANAGPAIGLDANDFASLGAFDPDANVTVDTSGASPTLTWGTNTIVGTKVTTQNGAGNSSFEIAVFTFSDFELDEGITLKASGTSPLALLSQGEMRIAGTIDVSAVFNSMGLTDAPGAGGGQGGFGTAAIPPQHGGPAAGAPLLAGGQLGPGGPLGGGSGSGGGSGGAGGHGEVFGGPTGFGGVDYVNLQNAIQGGSGGSAAGRPFGSGNFAAGGSGGGGIELGAVSNVTISSTGQVLANGSNGRSGDAAVFPGTGGGGGGGGNILIHATNISHSGLLSAKGGDGGGGIHTGGGGGGGDVLLAYSNVGFLDDDSGTVIVAGGLGGGVAGAPGESGDVDSIAAADRVGPPAVETFGYVIDWGDGSDVDTGNATIGTPGVNVGDVVAGSFDGTHTFADNGVFTVTLTVTGSNGGSDTKTFTMTVNNVAPLLTISGASDVSEGGSYALTLSSSDPGTDTIASWTINWGDGNTETVSGNPSSVNHTYSDGDNNYTISATATDEDGTFNSNTLAVAVANVAPTLTISGDATVNAGATYTLNLAETDPGADTITTWTINWGDGTQVVSGNPSSVTHTYATAGNFTISATAADEDGTFISNSIAVTVADGGSPGQGVTLIGTVLHVVGSTTGNDISIITGLGNSITVTGNFFSGGSISFNNSAITEIQIVMGGGHDIVAITPSVNQQISIDGGAGNDLLTGGSGRNVLLGGTGNDVLFGFGGDDVLMGGDGNDDMFGGSGHDVLVGGNGRDYLDGGSGRDLVIGSQDEDELRGGGDEDILIGGWTIHDNNVAALDAVMAIWRSSDSFNTRVATLTASGGLLQAGVAVFDDEDDDEISGGSGRDLIFGDTFQWDGAVDQISLQAAQDRLIAVN